MRLDSLVTQKFAGCAIEAYLARRFRYLDEPGWLRFIHGGMIRKGEVACRIGERIQAGDTITCILPDIAEPEADLDYRIIHEDPWLLGIDKPGNLLVHRRGKALTRNLIYHLRFVRTPCHPEADIVNRLDRHTSGVVLVARDKETLAAMNRTFSEKAVRKEYLAVVHGALAKETGSIVAPIERLHRNGPPSFAVTEIGGKDAETGYEVVTTLGTSFSLLRLWPRTGRTHQLRVHMAAAGHPLVGDPLYGLPREDDTPDAPPLFPRQALHCAALHFVHPRTGAVCAISAPLARDMEELIVRLDQKGP